MLKACPDLVKGNKVSDETTVHRILGFDFYLRLGRDMSYYYRILSTGFPDYSLMLSTGFIRATLNECKLTVKKETNNSIPAATNMAHQGNSILKA
ncbi:MAG: hypothetical protein ACI9CQ_003458 [Saprospiraceae bacterium]